MSLLVKLSKHASIVVLSQWCELRAITEVDTAFCNQIERSEMLELFQHKSFVVNVSVKTEVQVRYILNRCLKITGINFMNQIVNGTLIIILDSSYISTIVFGNIEIKEREAWVSFIKKCRKLSRLKINHQQPADDCCVSQLHPKVLKQLKVLKSPMCANNLEHVSISCYSLVMLDMYIQDSDMLWCEENVLMRLISHNKSLQCIRLQSEHKRPIVSNNTMRCIQAHCKDIWMLQINTDSVLDFKILTEIGNSACGGGRKVYLSLSSTVHPAPYMILCCGFGKETGKWALTPKTSDELQQIAKLFTNDSAAVHVEHQEYMCDAYTTARLLARKI